MAIVDGSGAVKARFTYSSFGTAKFLTAAFAAPPLTSADWNFLFHGEFQDIETGMFNYGFRYYHAQLGRWLSRDPIAESGGLNLYSFLMNQANSSLDFLGLINDDGNGNQFGPPVKPPKAPLAPTSGPCGDSNDTDSRESCCCKKFGQGNDDYSCCRDGGSMVPLYEAAGITRDQCIDARQQSAWEGLLYPAMGAGLAMGESRMLFRATSWGPGSLGTAGELGFGTAIGHTNANTALLRWAAGGVCDTKACSPRPEEVDQHITL